MPGVLRWGLTYCSTALFMRLSQLFISFFVPCGLIVRYISRGGTGCSNDEPLDHKFKLLAKLALQSLHTAHGKFEYNKENTGLAQLFFCVFF